MSNKENICITRAEFETFWNHQINVLRCNICGQSTTWQPLLNPSEPTEMALLHSLVNYSVTEDNPGGYGYNFYAISCSNCGNTVKFFDYIVNTFIQKLEEATNDDL